jgi:hypothetical protein
MSTICELSDYRQKPKQESDLSVTCIAASEHFFSSQKMDVPAAELIDQMAAFLESLKALHSGEVAKAELRLPGIGLKASKA